MLEIEGTIGRRSQSPSRRPKQFVNLIPSFFNGLYPLVLIHKTTALFSPTSYGFVSS